MGAGDADTLDSIDVALARMAPEERLAVNVDFAPITLIATADVSYAVEANTAYVANLISPQRWVDQPFFVASEWLSGEPSKKSGARIVERLQQPRCIELRDRTDAERGPARAGF